MDKAVEWFECAATAPAPTPDASRALLYDLAATLEEAGETARALAVFVELEGEELREVYEAFLVLADSKRDIGRKDLLELVGKYMEESNFIELENVSYSSNGSVNAHVKLKIGTDAHEASSTGVGPVDAVLKAIETIVKPQVDLEEFLIQAITHGSDDVAKVHMRLIKSEKPYYGFASNQDIVLASAQAFVDALNKIPVKEYVTA